METLDFYSDKFVLGAICKRGHVWGQSGQSLRYKKGNRGCVECQRLLAQAKDIRLRTLGITKMDMGKALAETIAAEIREDRKVKPRLRERVK